LRIGFDFYLNICFSFRNLCSYILPPPIRGGDNSYPPPLCFLLPFAFDYSKQQAASSRQGYIYPTQQQLQQQQKAKGNAKAKDKGGRDAKVRIKTRCAKATFAFGYSTTRVKRQKGRSATARAPLLVALQRMPSFACDCPCAFYLAPLLVTTATLARAHRAKGSKQQATSNKQGLA
jgi:hypothetical protein